MVILIVTIMGYAMVEVLNFLDPMTIAVP